MAKDKNIEIIELSEEILKNIELDEIPLRSILLKCARLARLTGNADAINLFSYELNGYPKSEGGINSDAFNLSRQVNRPFKQIIAGKEFEYMFMETVAELEAEVDVAQSQMAVAYDRDVSIASSNPSQYVIPPIGNGPERTNLRQLIIGKTRKLQLLRNGYYSYVLAVYAERRFENITESIFQKKKVLADTELSEKVPEAIQKFVAVYENLGSNNSEDWANAVHSCRRIIKDFADVLYPASGKEIDIGSGKKLELNSDNYIARLKEYIKEQSNSERFNQVVGSNLDYIGDRIDALYGSSNKGTHAKVEREEAERYVIYTYLLLADIISLQKETIIKQ